jgi:hypothetical protein
MQFEVEGSARIGIPDGRGWNDGAFPRTYGRFATASMTRSFRRQPCGSSVYFTVVSPAPELGRH